MRVKVFCAAQKAAVPEKKASRIVREVCRME